MSTEQPQSGTMKLAHVLFMDIVGYSKLPIDEQTHVLATLQEMVHNSVEVARAQSTKQLTSIPTGDGMALVFFNEPTAPVECALEIAKALKRYPEIQLRMGVHSGPVNEIIDVNERINVAGGGINMAQRVMDSGDAGHILLSNRVAEDLSQYTRWKPLLHDLKEVEVKHAVRVHLFNLYTDEVGNPVLPHAVRRRKKRSRAPLVIAAALAIVVIPTAAFFVLRSRARNARPTRPESEYQTLLARKADSWVDTIFASQAGDGGIKMAPSAAEATTQVWQTAQCLVGAFASHNSLEGDVPKIKNAFKYIEGLHHSPPTEGWNLYGNANPYTITEIGSWVTLASIASLDSKTKIWDDAEREEMLKHVVRNLDETIRRQDSSGGWKPIRDEGSEFTRTYSTLMAIWSLVEAKQSPFVSGRIGSKYDENIRKGINWLIVNYKAGQGWVPNPNRSGQKDRFDGLTAQVLFVLSRAETLDASGFIKNDQVYRSAKQELIKNRQFADWSVETNNSHLPDPDLRFVGTEFLAEGSTYLWFPWTLAELSQLAVDPGLSQEERDAAAQLRLDIFNANYDKLDNYVESANLMYVVGENLFGVSTYLDEVQKAAASSHAGTRP